MCSLKSEGQVPKRSNGADCKSAGVSLRRFESFPAHTRSGSSSVGRASAFQAEGRGFESRFPLEWGCGSSSVGRASASQAEGRGFESRFPLEREADVAQLVEHFLGKEEVTGSIPVISSGEGV